MSEKRPGGGFTPTRPEDVMREDALHVVARHHWRGSDWGCVCGQPDTGKTRVEFNEHLADELVLGLREWL